MLLPDYDYYCLEYRGDRLDEAVFPRLIRRAGAYIEQVTCGRSRGKAAQLHRSAINDAACAIAEEMQLQEQGGEVASASNDGYSETYVTSGRSPQQRLYDIALRYLGMTGLMYQGGG